jgi:hypothetical protein
MKILTFLHLHLNQRHTPQEWAMLVGIDIIDADGWRRADFKLPCDLEEFVQRVAQCTIAPVNADPNPDIVLNRDLPMPKPGRWNQTWIAPDNIRAIQEIQGGF